MKLKHKQYWCIAYRDDGIEYVEERFQLFTVREDKQEAAREACLVRGLLFNKLEEQIK